MLHACSLSWLLWDVRGDPTWVDCLLHDCTDGKCVTGLTSKTNKAPSTAGVNQTVDLVGHVKLVNSLCYRCRCRMQPTSRPQPFPLPRML